jgi:hypothetical protein
MLAPTNLPAVQEQKFHDVVIVKKKTYACARVEGVPPENFGVERNAKLCTQDWGYCFHEEPRSQSDLIADGYDPEQIKKLPSYSMVEKPESQSRDTVEESRQSGGDDGLNTANRQIRVTEHYVRMDYEGEGRTALYRVTTGGEECEILRRQQDDEEEYTDEIVEVDAIPFATMTPVIITHRLFGRSVADLVMDIQRIKTALLRGALDNLYLHNNPRVEVPESHASDNTLDDLLVSRPGGIVRTKAPGGLQWQVVPDITASVYPALQYFDATREWRTGVSRQGQGVDPNALQNQVATIANQMANAAQQRIKLIARIFAETGIKDLFSLLHGVIRRNGSQPQTVKLRNKWVTVNPREWKERDDMTINVGLGTGSKEQQLAMLQLIIGAQEKGIAIGLVSKKNLYNSGKELIKIWGRKDPEAFFTPPGQQHDPNDPDSAPIQPPENPDIQKAKIEAELRDKETQQKAAIENTQAQADIASNNAKMQNDAIMAERKFQFDAALEEKRFELEKELKLIDAQLKQQEHEAQMQFNREKHSLDLDSKRETHAMNMQKTSANGDGQEKPKDNSSDIAEAFVRFAEVVSRDKKLRKNKDGTWQTEAVQ